MVLNSCETLNEKEELHLNGILIAKFNGEQGFLNVSEIKGYMIDDSSVEWFLKSYHLNNDEEHIIEYHVMTNESDQYTISFNVNQSNEVSIIIT